MYKIMPGMYLSLNDLQFKRSIKNQNNLFSNHYIVIDYCLKGGYRFRFENERVGIVNKGNTLYYVGINTFEDGHCSNTGIRSIGIMCYLNEIVQPIEQILGLSQNRIAEYCARLAQRKEFLIIDTDPELRRILDQIYQYIECDQRDYSGLIKLRAMELFLLEINNYQDYQSSRKKYYSQATIDQIETMCRFIEKNADEHFTIEDLAIKFKMSKTKLKGCFKHVYGVGPYTYLKNYRLERASQLLAKSSYSILEVANMVGYSSPSKFGVAFKERFLVNPLKYRKMHS